MSGFKIDRNRMHKAGWVVSWLVILFLLHYAFLGKHGYFATLRLTEKIVTLESENLRLQRENEKLWEEINYRKTDLFLEELARVELGYIKPGEKMIRWVPVVAEPTTSPGPVPVTSGSEATPGTSHVAREPTPSFDR